MWRDLFDRDGWDRGGPVSQWIQSQLELAMSLELPERWQASFLWSTNNPALRSLILPDGMELHVDQVGFEAMPKEFQVAVTRFWSTVPDLLRRFIAATTEAGQLVADRALLSRLIATPRGDDPIADLIKRSLLLYLEANHHHREWDAFWRVLYFGEGNESSLPEQALTAYVRERLADMLSRIVEAKDKAKGFLASFENPPAAPATFERIL